MVFRLLEGCTVTEDGDSAETFGVAVFLVGSYEADEFTDPSSALYRNADVTFNREEMYHHVCLWNELQPSLSQLKDLITDIIEGNHSLT